MTDRSSKGKGRSSEWDIQSLQSLSLSDYHDSSTPRSTPMSFPSTFAQAPMDQTYTQSTEYSHDANGPAYTYANYGHDASGHGHTYADSLSQSPGSIMATDVYGGSNASNMGSGSSVYSRTNCWDTTSTSYRSVSSSNTSNSFSTSASSAPSRISNVDTHINRMPQPRQRYQLPCEFSALGCGEVFAGDEQTEWEAHTETHLGGNFPSRLKCWFCDDFGLFDAKNVDGDTRYNFKIRMQHIRDHILAGDYRLEDMRPDGYIANHLKKQGLINEQGYQVILQPARVPAPAPAGGSSHHHHHHRSSHRHLAPVVEEAGPSSSSGSKDRRSEKKADKKREHTRDSHHHKKRSSTK